MSEYSQSHIWEHFWNKWTNNKIIYPFIDSSTLQKKSTTKIIEILTDPDRFTGDLNNLNQHTLDKFSKSLHNIREFKKLIPILPVEIYNQIKDTFLDLVADFHSKNRFEDEDYKLLEDKFSISLENITKREWKLILEETIQNNTEVIEAIMTKIKPTELIRDNSTLQWKQYRYIADTEYLKNEYKKVSSIYKTNLEKIKIKEFMILMIENNPEYLYDNCWVNNLSSYFVSNDLLELLDTYVKITENTINDFKVIAEEKWINVDIFMNYIFSSQWLIQSNTKDVFWIKKTLYSLNTEIFN